MLVTRELLILKQCKISETYIKRFFYNVKSKNDTIFAPSTAIQSSKGSPVSVIRVSGSKTDQVIASLTLRETIKNKQNNFQQCEAKRKLIEPRKAVLTKVRFPNSNELIDIAMLLWFPKPGSYTGEDVCEFHLHGSLAIMRTMLSALGSLPGLRPAEPGEFTRRAVMNGKMSLIQAESLPELISSQTDFQRRMALKGLDGATRDKYKAWIQKLIEILAHLEASIDFGEDELLGEKEVVDDCIKKISILAQDMLKFIKISKQTRQMVKSGAKVVILGKPNAGKSSLMNIISRDEKSIVSNISGTTRDVVEHSFELEGHAMTLYDTAGLKPDSNDLIEREGIKRAIKAARRANIILYVIDSSELEPGKKLVLEDILFHLKQARNNEVRQTLHLIINKIDLNQDCSKAASTLDHALKGATKPDGYLDVTTSFLSCKTGDNFEQFLSRHAQQLDKLACDEELESSNINYVNERHLSLLISTQRNLSSAGSLKLDNIDKMAQHVRNSVDYLSRIVGTVSNEQVIDVIFKDFCIGK